MTHPDVLSVVVEMLKQDMESEVVDLLHRFHIDGDVIGEAKQILREV